ncbi:hypothetical protein SRHO_G00128420 [Serrasalmus rhombeus]
MKLGMIILSLLLGVSSGVGAPCGKDLTNPRGEFFSPRYPYNYPNNAYCTWRLLASERQTVNLTFTFVELETCCDSIRVYDGPTEASPLLGHLPQDQRYHFNSMRNYLTVVFSSDHGITHQGFQAQWEFSVGASCGEDLTNSSGEFFSPQYPNNYPSNADCTWRLLTSERQVVHLTFTFVDLEECCDSIMVYDGPSAAYPLLDQPPQDKIYHFSSTRNYLTVVFSSDSKGTRQGFQAQWEFSDKSPCGEDLTNPRGEFFSPQYPNNYPNDADCTWRLLASERQTVNLIFKFVELEMCCDSISVYDGPTDAYPLLGDLPQDKIYHFNSTRQYLTVVFSSDSGIVHQGFWAQWVFSVGAPCSGDLTNSSGEFFSPQFPNNYPNNADCTWRLLASETQVVNLNFTFVDLEACCDSIKVYDGPTDAYPLLGRLPQDQRNHFISTRNYMTVVFLADISGTRQGFQAQWVFSDDTSCCGDLTKPRGEFFSPQFPNNYPNDADYTWRILASERQVVNLTFTFVDLEECCDSIRVYDGPSAAYPLLGHLPEDQRYHFKSTRNYLTILLSTDHIITHQGFRAQWEFSVGASCGEDLTNPRGEFFSPQYPYNYPENADCTWRLLASETQVINLTFTFVDLEKCCDSIRVYDGPTDAYPLLGRLPKDQRYNFNSTANYITVVFSSDDGITHKGFQAQWAFSEPTTEPSTVPPEPSSETLTPTSAPCGEDLTNPRGEFFSPQFPNYYPNNARCTWRLLVPEGQVVNLTFMFVSLEMCCDSIRVYDGPSDTYPLLGRLTEDQRRHFSSTRNSLTVMFLSDNSITGQGFRAQWVFSEPTIESLTVPPEPSTEAPTPMSVGASCGGDLTNARGEFFSPQYPNNYPNNANCTWTLLASETQVINLNFTFVDFETCCDSIRVYDGPTDAYPLLGRLPQDQRYRSTRNALTVVFSSDSSVTRQGFRAQWVSAAPHPERSTGSPGPSVDPTNQESVGASCGEDLTNARGEFFSLQYPNNYPNNANCTWRLLASETQVINLNFTFVDFETCCDSIRVYDGPTDAYPLLGRLPQDQRYRSTRNALTVVFSSDSSVTRQGFRAQWVSAVEAPCGEDLTNPSGEFFSPQFPNYYPHNASCTWRLLAPERQVVNLTFMFVHLEECCDSISVYDGPNDTYPLLGILAQDQRHHFNSTRNSLTIVFLSDNSITDQGFRAQWVFSGAKTESTAKVEKEE